MTKPNFTQYWKQLYNEYLHTNDIAPVINDPATKGLIWNAIQKYAIPYELQDDFRQEIYISITQAFRTYDPAQCDKILPYVLSKITIATYQFLNNELYSGTFGTKYNRTYATSTSIIPEGNGSFIDPLEEQEESAYNKAKAEAFEKWIRSYLSDPLELSIYCQQWGIFGHKKLTNEESSKSLGIDVDTLKKTKQKIACRMYQFLSTARKSEKVFKKFGDLSYYLEKEYKNWGNFSNSIKNS